LEQLLGKIKTSASIITLNKKSAIFGTIAAIVSAGTVLLLILTALLPQGSVKMEPPFKHFDKVLHFSAYLFLMFWLMQFMYHLFDFRSKHLLLFCVIIACFIGGLTEFLQFAYKERGRTGDINDFLADITGILLIALFFIIVKRKKTTEKPSK
jgi:VanZ family protein